jgi:predicted dehydrogenase
LWLGPAPVTKYTPDICPYKWRFWWDYGTGEAGNWGCHILDIAYWALDLKYPTKVAIENPNPDPAKTPTAFHSTFDFPAVGNRPALKLHWYQGKPAVLDQLGVKPGPGVNTLFIGEKGMLTSGFDTKGVKLLSSDGKEELTFKLPSPTLEKSPGFHKEWLAACRGGKPSTCDFAYSGPMTETVLLANAAFRAKGGFDWDAANQKATGNSSVDEYLVPKFRKGWEV